MKKFDSAADYKKAIEGWVVRRGKIDQVPVARVKKSVVFDAFLARIARSNHGFVLRGGFAMEMRFQTGRAEGGLNLSVKEKLDALKNSPEMTVFLKKRLEAVLSEDYERDDSYFTFSVADSDSTVDGAGYRYPVKASLAGTVFEEFFVDVSVNDYLDTTVLRRESQAAPAVWGESESDAHYRIETISGEQHFAEKLIRYALEKSQPEIMARDLVDLFLLTRSGLDDEELKSVISQIFSHKNKKMPESIPSLDKKHEALFVKEAREVSLTISLDEVYRSVRDYYVSLSSEMK